MARSIGKIEPEDDYTHELRPEENFNGPVWSVAFQTPRRINDQTLFAEDGIWI